MVASCGEEEAPNTPPAGACDDLNYTYSDVKSIIDASCIGCHAVGEDAESAGDFTTYQGLQEALSADSETFKKQINWEMSNPDYNMPPAEQMPTADIQKLECWISAGFPE